MDDDCLPKARPIAFSDSPRFQRSHNSVFSAAVNPRRNLCSIATLHLSCKTKCCIDPVANDPTRTSLSQFSIPNRVTVSIVTYPFAAMGEVVVSGRNDKLG